MRMRTAMVATATIATLVGLGGPAQATRTTHNTHVGPSTSYQYAITNRESGGEIRLFNFQAGTLDPDHCVDVSVDWQTAGTGHYDIRTLRNCMPGGAVSTDPHGNGYWQEGWPNNCCPVVTNQWGDPRQLRTITGINIGGAYMIDDDYVNGDYDLIDGNREMWQGNPPTDRARTQGDMFAHVRTLYQNGSTDTTDPYQIGPCEADPTCNFSPQWAGRIMMRSAVDPANQAANVVAAYAENGAYSECMTARGYDVPWQWSIHLDPNVTDRALIAQERVLQAHLADDSGVVSTTPFLHAGVECRNANEPASDARLSRIKARAHTQGLLDRARQLGWSPDRPFAGG